jgi:uncharacterized repeat protein (TIGR01451 family)
MLMKTLLFAVLGLGLSVATLSAQRLTNLPPTTYPAIQVTPSMQAAKNLARPSTPVASTSTVTTCQNLVPMCTAPNLFYTLTTSVNSGDANTTNAGNNYACLSTTPNPMWYYIQIDQPGDIFLALSAQSDIDYAIWGPFPSVAAAEASCGGYGAPHDCSYSPTNNELPRILGGQTGEIYVLLITNFSNILQPATLTQLSGSGSMGCSQFSSMSGTVFNDINSNCIGEVTDTRIPNMFIQTSWGYSSSDANGEYHTYIDSGSHTVTQIVPAYLSALINPICNTSYTQSFTYTPTSVMGLDFHNEVLECPYLMVDVRSNLRRRCMPNLTVVSYCNNGFAASGNAEVFVELPQYVHLLSADAPYTIDANGVYVFNVGVLAAGECGTINIIDSVACVTGIMGLAQCTRAWITPPNSCVEDTIPVGNPNDPWDRSSVSVNGVCDNANDVVRFVIHNSGSSSNGNMLAGSEYRIYVDGLLVYTGVFQIAGGADFIVEVPATGGVVRLEADQRPNHPGNSHPNDVVQGCGNSGNNATLADWLAYNAQSTDDADVAIAEQCLPIVDSYDPNDKRVSPNGAGANHQVLPNTMLDYTIRFQNTGNAVAYRVVIRDTLSPHFDISTLHLEGASHNYNFYLAGTEAQPILVFDHQNINLIDSATNALASQGFVSFKIAPRSTTPLGTRIDNNAAIYFDFNAPIYTNSAWITVDNPELGTPIQVNVLSANSLTADAVLPVLAYPNPTESALTVDLREAIDANIQVYSLNGQLLMQKNSNQQQIVHLDLADLASGMYLVQVVNGRQNTMLKVVKK